MDPTGCSHVIDTHDFAARNSRGEDRADDSREHITGSGAGEFGTTGEVNAHLTGRIGHHRCWTLEQNHATKFARRSACRAYAIREWNFGEDARELAFMGSDHREGVTITNPCAQVIVFGQQRQCPGIKNYG